MVIFVAVVLGSTLGLAYWRQTPRLGPYLVPHHHGPQASYALNLLRDNDTSSKETFVTAFPYGGLSESPFLSLDELDLHLS